MHKNRLSFALAVALASSYAAFADEKPTRKKLELPGIVVDFQKRVIDVDGYVCLRRGTIELIACTKDTKEHESIFVVQARPMHIHTALFLLGARPGRPPSRRPVDDTESVWVDVIPKGARVEVSVAFLREGTRVEVPIGRFLKPAAEPREGEESARAPKAFVFAGSRLRDVGRGPRKYLADVSGNVISTASFGDEVICLPGVHARRNSALLWRVDPKELPPLGTPVKLRLRPVRDVDSKRDGNPQK